MATIPTPSAVRECLPWPIRVLIGMVVMFLLAALLAYPVENWRGKRAWEQCKRDLEARGEILDWDALIPPPVPDEQNFFNAPKMTDWFVGRGTNELAKRLEGHKFYESSQSEHANVIANVRVVSLGDDITSENADIILRYNPPILIRDDGALSNETAPEFVIIPLIKFQDVPLLTGVENLARQGQLSYRLDPKVNFSKPGQHEPSVTLRWEDMTAKQALLALLNSYDLQWIDDPETGGGLIKTKQLGDSQIYVEPAAHEQISKLFERRIGSQTNVFQGAGANAPQGFTLLVKAANLGTPLRVVVRAVKPPNLKEVSAFFPSNTVVSGTRAESPGDTTVENGFRILMNPPSYSATEYIAWSDQFGSDFDLIREALKRPCARMDGDYRQPQSVPIPNYVTMRNVTRTLVQRAQCFLLLGQSEKALDELTFVHNLSQVLEGRPTGKSMTVVAVATAFAVTEHYTETIADGLRMHAWREPQLVALQEQLKQVNLLPLLAAGFRSERASLPRMTDYIRANLPSKGRGLWLFPRGWVYQNYARNLAMHQEMIGCLDLTNRIILARETDRFKDKMAHYKTFWPYDLLAYIAMPNYTKVIETLAFNQTRADEAFVACALERYRLANGCYPETLDELLPKFAERLPHDLITGKPLKYRRTEKEKFLLYATGWNATDDGGAAGQKKVNSLAMANVDWLWPE